MEVKGKTTDGIVSRYLNRRISTRITKVLLKLNVRSPNKVTITTSIIGFLVYPTYLLGNYILAGILTQLASILDGVDGELARALNIESKYGAFLDSMLDRLVDILIILGASTYSVIYLNYVSPVHITVYMLALSGDLIVSYIHSRSQLDFRIHPMLIGKIPNIASRDVRLFIIFITSIFNLVFEGLLIVAILSYLYTWVKFIDILYSIKSSPSSS